ncbi:hypothetical protein DCC39_02600 [Pueribacillus theae]|uniref:SCP2 domain-containing protein n=1 Tax=Pueribacillus theae TaxID=2171751 RepID=A0A2U1K7A9_9BACI|nr:hypothetical protein [Pueribacillus theae]PWA13039.1 hypothetical protein DCC39_02600 [Pueribacillus theae]
MAVFNNEEEMYSLIGGFFESIKDSEPIKEMMEALEPDAGFNAYVQFVYHSPEGKVTWYEEKDGSIGLICGETDLRAELKFEQSADIGHKFWLGELDLQEALARQLLKAEGPLVKALKAMPQIEKIYPMYRDYLEKTGRTDLLAVKQ